MRRGSLGWVSAVSAAEDLRGQLEAAEPSMPINGANVGRASSLPSNRVAITDRQIDARGKARAAIEAIARVSRAVVLWIVGGGTIRSFLEQAHVRHESAKAWLQTGLEQLADHYRIA